jgi:hypothetical protein
VSELAAEAKYDYLIIESTGIGEPLPVAQTFSFKDAKGNSIASVARLDTCVTVVDTAEFWGQWNSRESLKDRGEQATDTDERTITDLLVDQIQVFLFLKYFFYKKIASYRRWKVAAGEEAARLCSLCDQHAPARGVCPMRSPYAH